MFKLMHVQGLIKLGGNVKVNTKGQIFEVEDKATRDILIENKNAIDITDGIPADKNTDKDILLIQLENEKARNDKLAKQVSELRQIIKNSNIEINIESELLEDEKKEDKAPVKKGGK